MSSFSDATEIFSIRGADDRQNFQQRVSTFVTESLTCNSGNLKNFFTITAYKTSTVQIVMPGENLVQQVLEPYDTYSIASAVVDPVADYTGNSLEPIKLPFFVGYCYILYIISKYEYHHAVSSYAIGWPLQCNNPFP